MAVTTSVGESPLACKLRDVQVHLDLALLAAVRVGKNGALHGRQLGAQKIGRQIVQSAARKDSFRKAPVE